MITCKLDTGLHVHTVWFDIDYHHVFVSNTYYLKVLGLACSVKEKEAAPSEPWCSVSLHFRRKKGWKQPHLMSLNKICAAGTPARRQCYTENIKTECHGMCYLYICMRVCVCIYMYKFFSISYTYIYIKMIRNTYLGVFCIHCSGIGHQEAIVVGFFWEDDMLSHKKKCWQCVFLQTMDMLKLNISWW